MARANDWLKFNLITFIRMETTMVAELNTLGNGEAYERENGRIRLQPANTTMQPFVYDADQVQVQGIVVGVMRKYR